MASKNYVPVYIDRGTGNHWVITEGRHGLNLSSVNAIQKPGAYRTNCYGVWDDLIGFVAEGEIIEVRWDIPSETALMEIWGDKAQEHKRAWDALTGVKQEGWLLSRTARNAP